MKKILTTILLLFLSLNLLGQKDSTEFNIYDLTLEELMNLKVSIASQNETPLRETPGIVTLITEEEIKNSGARDLLDILRYVPGFDFGAEMDHVIGLGVRGNNATEGKVLLMLDGQQINETNFGSFAFGQHIHLDNVKQIEIIRGPGSAMYGGMAELSVINIITKTGQDYQGTSASVTSSYAANSPLRKNIQLGIGKEFINGLEISASGFGNFSNRSNLMVSTLDGSSVINNKDSSDIMSANLNIGMDYKDFSIKYIYDKFTFDNLEKKHGSVLFEGHYLEAKYKIKLGNKLTIAPTLNWKNLKPWQFIDFPDYTIYNTINNRYTANIVAKYHLSDKTYIIGGYEIYNDLGRKLVDTVYYHTGKSEISITNQSFYTEGFFNTKFINLIVGARLDHHNIYGTAFVPRLAITKQFNKFHFKLLYSWAFKTPTIANIDINNKIKPEFTNVAELEAGYIISENIQVLVNLFDINISDAIVYLWDGEDNYHNYEKTGSKGIETEIRLKEKRGYINLSYSYYKANPDNTVPDYSVDGNDKIYGAYPAHKLALTSNFKITDNFSINPSFLFYSKRYTYAADANWNMDLIEFDPSYLTNIYLLYKNAFSPGLDFGFGVYDVFNYKYQFINPYKAGIEPISEPGREFSISIKYNFKM